MIPFIFITTFMCFSVYFIREYHEYALTQDKTVQRLKRALIPVFPELKLVKLMKGTKSYTLNKSKIYLCTEKHGVKYQLNILTYVLLHELAHVLCEDVGHTSKFMNVFSGLLHRAQLNGLYNPNMIIPENYCI